MAGEDYDYTPEDAQINSRVSFLRILPGGASATTTEHAVAILVLIALGFLIVVRKGFKPVLAS